MKNLNDISIIIDGHIDKIETTYLTVTQIITKEGHTFETNNFELSNAVDFIVNEIGVENFIKLSQLLQKDPGLLNQLKIYLFHLLNK